jgi:ABC-type bacteriocin/lantibiotic exporter with double-glycine peptidase domain
VTIVSWEDDPVRLEVPRFQQRRAECGNTALKSVCWYHGRRISARRLGALAGLTAEGIDHAGMVAAAEATGAIVTAGDRGTVAMLARWLERGLPVIVGWWAQGPGDAPFDPAWSLAERRARDCGHYSVVCGLDARRVHLVDPDGGAAVTRAIASFEATWYDTDTPAYHRVDRWYMVIRY